MITFKINISNRPALTPDMAVLLFLDTDQLATTGDPSNPAGSDYLIELDPGSVALAKWNGTDYVTAPSQSSLTFAYDATGATIKVSASDLGKTKGINLRRSPSPGSRSTRAGTRTSRTPRRHRA